VEEETNKIKRDPKIQKDLLNLKLLFHPSVPVHVNESRQTLILIEKAVIIWCSSALILPVKKLYQIL